ncbi:beta-1 3-galactosyl-O-glycosyl-glycoprotein beta-1 6-N-acetylglucosaminyltransferase [Biomphalaria pfeifferi]|uniref:Beta-1 3-galactosyl-O-glycosyl-glycoprotein beta-1 6-N-acetylglucosaminyltransferase n=1 Tax=Biomphalaria pfeifferi TaxID=112525 RepID=A0AAD8C346_BIOPF|nr:beta-1 3-galactosyl-O-glycosyl-glycoprotein beta-1 6-N-acetylglucosaminyltransferase [Biomphalaria pfeifferi]
MVVHIKRQFSLKLFLLYSIKKVYRWRHVIMSLLLLALVLCFYIFLIFGVPFELKKPTPKPIKMEFINASDSASVKAFANKWVGFPHLSYINCQEVLTYPITNEAFEKTLHRIADSALATESSDCPSFRTKHGFHRFPSITEEEQEFPIAFIILFHKDLDQVLFLLRAIYRPHNVYCLSVDLNSGPTFIQHVRSVIACLPNVFLAKTLEQIVYAGFSRLMADIHCMKELLTSPVKWRYLVNIPGQQFPLRTNLEMVKIFKIYNGANDQLGVSGKKSLPRRYKIKHHVVSDKKTGRNITAESVGRYPPPPHNFQIVKGSAYGTFSRAFVDIVMTDRRALDLIEWSRGIESPDEYVWSTLHHTKIMKVPGGFTGDPESKRSMTTFVAWQREVPCESIHVRWICIFSAADLPMLKRRPELFANKFYIDLHPVALHCLDQYIFNLTITNQVRDLQLYRELPFILTNQRPTLMNT